jgi:hypothetical protein
MKEGIMAITALGGSTGIAKQFRKRVPVKVTRRSKQAEEFQMELNQQVRPRRSSVDLRA